MYNVNISMGWWVDLFFIIIFIIITSSISILIIISLKHAKQF